MIARRYGERSSGGRVTSLVEGGECWAARVAGRCVNRRACRRVSEGGHTDCSIRARCALLVCPQRQPLDGRRKQWFGRFETVPPAARRAGPKVPLTTVAGCSGWQRNHCCVPPPQYAMADENPPVDLTAPNPFPSLRAPMASLPFVGHPAHNNRIIDAPQPRQRLPVFGVDVVVDDGGQPRDGVHRCTARGVQSELVWRR